MAKVLFITEKWHDHNHQEHGLTNNMYNLIGSYECSGYGSWQHCPIAPENIWSSEGVDRALLDNEYDAAIISVYYHLPSREVAAKVGHKTFMFWWDSSVSLGQLRSWSDVIHQGCFDFGKGEEYPNCFSVEVPQDTRIFKKDDTVEDIDVSFAGSLNPYWADRFPLVQKIQQNANFSFWYGGGRHPVGSLSPVFNLPIEEYAKIYRRSKICLNLSVGHGQPQRKGRAFEIAASGQFMLSNYPETFRGKDGLWFEDGVDYVSFNNDDVMDKIRYYLEHEEERNKIADNMYQKYLNNYSPPHFWKKILNICGVTV